SRENPVLPAAMHCGEPQPKSTAYPMSIRSACTSSRPARLWGNGDDGMAASEGEFRGLNETYCDERVTVPGERALTAMVGPPSWIDRRVERLTSPLNTSARVRPFSVVTLVGRSSKSSAAEAFIRSAKMVRLSLLRSMGEVAVTCGRPAGTCW